MLWIFIWSFLIQTTCQRCSERKVNVGWWRIINFVFFLPPDNFSTPKPNSEITKKKLAVPRSKIFQESLKTVTYQVNSSVLLNWNSEFRLNPTENKVKSHNPGKLATEFGSLKDDLESGGMGKDNWRERQQDGQRQEKTTTKWAKAIQISGKRKQQQDVHWIGKREMAIPFSNFC